MAIHQVGEIYQVEQRDTDGFINGTAMCVAHERKITEWVRNQGTLELIASLAEDLGLEIMYENSHTSNIASVSDAYPDLVVFKMGSPANGGGVWLQPDLAIQLAQWCSPKFALQVSRWVREWFPYFLGIGNLSF